MEVDGNGVPLLRARIAALLFSAAVSLGMGEAAERAPSDQAVPIDGLRKFIVAEGTSAKRAEQRPGRGGRENVHDRFSLDLDRGEFHETSHVALWNCGIDP